MAPAQYKMALAEIGKLSGYCLVLFCLAALRNVLRVVVVVFVSVFVVFR